MTTWEDSNSLRYESEEDQANVALMARVGTLDAEIPLEGEVGSESDEEKVISKELFPGFTHYELTISLLVILETHELLKIEFEELKKSHETISHENKKPKEDFLICNEEK